MKDWLQSLDPREQIFVITAVLFVVFAIAWFAVWKPLDTGQQSAALRVEDWKTSIAALRPMKSQLQAQGGNQAAPAGQNQSMVVIIDNTLRQRGLYEFITTQPANTGQRRYPGGIRKRRIRRFNALAWRREPTIWLACSVEQLFSGFR